MNRHGIRLRLTLLFALVQCVVIFAFCVLVHWLFGMRLMAELDRSLLDKATALAASYEWDEDVFEVDMGEDASETLWPDTYVEMQGAGGVVLYRNRPGPLLTASGEGGTEAGAAGAPRFYFTGGPALHTELRCARLADSRHGPAVSITAAAPTERIRRRQAQLLLVMGLSGAVTTAAATAAGWLLAGRLLQPLSNISAEARRITAARLHERLPVANPHDEIGALASTLNEMIERLELSFERTRRFTADAAHELRTPLSCIRSEVEVALRQPREPGEYRRVLQSALEEVERLSRLSDSLLELARLDRGELTLASEPVDLSSLAAEALESLRPGAEKLGKTLTRTRDAGPHRVEGDPRLLRQVAVNLIDNAIEHGGDRVSVDVNRTGDSVVLSVWDSGPPIDAEHLARVFDRFYRSDPSRSRRSGGAGLGLSLAKEFVELHGGDISASSAAEHGTTFQVRLPAAKVET